MKKAIPQIALILLLCAIAGQTVGQSATSKASGKDSAISTILTADSLASGSYKDIYTSFFQLAVKDITGPAKSVTFNSNIYAIMLRHNDSLTAYKYYKKYTWLRNFNVSVGATLDSAYRFNGMTAGLTYTIVNNRDVTIRKQFLYNAMKDTTISLFLDLSELVGLAINRIPLAQRAPYRADFNSLFSDSTKKLADFDQTFQNIVKTAADSLGNRYPKYKGDIKSLLTDSKFNLYKAAQDAYQSQKALFQNRGLWTIGVTDTSYTTGIFSKSIQITSEYNKGLTDPQRPFNFQLDIKGTLGFTDDTLQSGQNLNRQIFTFTPGINLVLNGTKSHMPWLEFDVSGSYSNIWKGHLYKSENQIVNTINGTLRILVTDNIWIPITIKYDPKSGNVFGLLSVTGNFTSLGNLLKGNSKKS